MRKAIRLLVPAILCCQILMANGCGWVLLNYYDQRDHRLDPELEELNLTDISIADSPPDDSVTAAVIEGLQQLPDSGKSETFATMNLQDSQAVELTLEGARATALEGNLDLIVARFDPDIASQRIYQEIWRFESTFEGTLSRNRRDPPPPAIGPPPEGPTEVATDRFDPAIIFPLTTGGTLALRNDGTRTQLPGLSIPNVHDLAPTITYSQPLMRNLGASISTAPIQLAVLDRGRADASTKLTAIGVVAATERAYWVLMGVKKNLEIAQQQVMIAEEQLRVSRKLADAGVVTRVDVLRSESGLNARREIVVRAERDVLLATRELKRVMQNPDLPVESTTAVDLVSQPNLVGLSFDRDLLAEKALTTRLEMIDLALQLRQQSVNLHLAENSVLPDLSFIFEGKLLGTGTTHGVSARQAWKDDHEEWFAGLSFSVPLAGNQSARRQVRERELILAQIAADRSRLTVSIVAQINDAVDSFEKNWQRINVAHQTVSVAKKTYQAETRLFEDGQRTSDLVLRAAEDLSIAQQQLVQSVVDFQLSRIDIALATGTVLGYSGVAFADQPFADMENAKLDESQSDGTRTDQADSDDALPEESDDTQSDDSNSDGSIPADVKKPRDQPPPPPQVPTFPIPPATSKAQ